MESSSIPTDYPQDTRGGVPAYAPHDEDQTHSSSATRSNLTILTNSSTVPMSVTKASVRRQGIVAEIGNACIQHSSVFEQSLRPLQADGIALSDLTYPMLHCGYRWVDIQPTYSRESVLVADFVNLLDRVVKRWMEEPRQSDKIHNIIDTHDIQIPDDRTPRHNLRPDIFVQGTGSPFPVQLLDPDSLQTGVLVLP